MNITRSHFTMVAATLALSATIQAATPAANQKFVAKAYQDLLNRAPNRPELALASAMLGSGATPVQIAGGITSSNEYRTDQIQKYFNNFLNRAAAPGEAMFYLNWLQNGATDDDIKGALLGSDEYNMLAGGASQSFLNKLYEDVLGRPIDLQAATTFGGMLRHGTSRQTVAGIVLHSAEAAQRKVTQWFAQFLHRAPLTAELNSNVQMLQLGAKDEALIDLLCGSDEYFQA